MKKNYLTVLSVLSVIFFIFIFIKMTSKKVINGDDLQKLLDSQLIKVTQTNYIVQSEQYKALYPDLLQVVIKNDTGLNIKDLVIAFVAWDKNGLPVRIKGQIDFTDGAYIKEVSCDGVNLINGGSYGSENGFPLDENLNIDSFKAIVISYTTFDGKTWHNEYYKDFRKLYEGNLNKI